MKLILASSSPRRAEILRAAGYSFSVKSIPVDESPKPGELAIEMVGRLALAKSIAVASASSDEEAIVLGADTTVEIDGEILAKPETPATAEAMLRKLRGLEHRVITGVALIAVGIAGVSAAAEKSRVEHEVTRVWVSELTDEEIAGYVASGEPLDKAGAYGIQGLASKFIPRIEGCYFNVVGLPIARVAKMLAQFESEISSKSK